MCAGVRAKSKVMLMNESETKRGNAHRLLSISPFLWLVWGRWSSRHRSLAAMQRLHPHEWISELEDPFAEHTQMTTEKLSHTQYTPLLQ